MTIPDKAELRKIAFAHRKAAHLARQGDPSHLLSGVLDAHYGAVIAGYMPIRTEIDPRPAMVRAAKTGTVCVPVIAGAGMALKFALWSPETTMTDGPFGASIPQTCEWITPDILIVPLVAFDRMGARLGYGGGYYDRTLAELRAAATVRAIGFAYGAQEVDVLPQEPTDAPLDLVVTEDEVIEIRALR